MPSQTVAKRIFYYQVSPKQSEIATTAYLGALATTGDTEVHSSLLIIAEKVLKILKGEVALPLIDGGITTKFYTFIIHK